MGEVIGNKDVRQATGRTWEQWFQELDSAPTRDADGEAAQAWMTEQHAEIGGWWCQVITRRWESRHETTVNQVS